MPKREFVRITLSAPEWRALVKRASDGIEIANNRAGHGGGYTMSRPAGRAIDVIRRKLRSRTPGSGEG